MKLSEMIEVAQGECPICLSYTYKLPCNIDLELCNYLRRFGNPKYDLNTVSLFKVEMDDWYIECMMGTKYVKLWMRKSLVDQAGKIGLLRDCLTEWLSDKFDSDIERG